MREGFGAALGSGGARGWCHIGVLRALEARGYVPSGVAGCSMGALVGAAWAAGKLDQLEAWARGLTMARLAGHMDPWLTGGGLIGGAAIGRILDTLEVPDRIEDLPRPLAVVSTDMATGREVWFTEGDLRDAVRGSASIPGIFRPHEVNGRWLLDGGLVNPVPVSAVRALGFHRTIAVNPNAKVKRALWSPEEEGLWAKVGWPAAMERLPRPIRSLLPEPNPAPDPEPNPAPNPAREPQAPDIIEVLSVSIDILTNYLTATRAAADPADVTLNADLLHLSVLELNRADEAIDEGVRLVAGAEAELHRLL